MSWSGSSTKELLQGEQVQEWTSFAAEVDTWVYEQQGGRRGFERKQVKVGSEEHHDELRLKGKKRRAVASKHGCTMRPKWQLPFAAYTSS